MQRERDTRIGEDYQQPTTAETAAELEVEVDALQEILQEQKDRVESLVAKMHSQASATGNLTSELEFQIKAFNLSLDMFWSKFLQYLTDPSALLGRITMTAFATLRDSALLAAMGFDTPDTGGPNDPPDPPDDIFKEIKRTITKYLKSMGSGLVHILSQDIPVKEWSISLGGELGLLGPSSTFGLTITFGDWDD